MSRTAPSGSVVAAMALFATGLWFVTFYLTFSTFWIKISLSALSLATLSVWIQPDSLRSLSLHLTTVLLGLVSASALYLIFWTGKLVSTSLFSFAGDQIGSIYAKGQGTPLWVIFLLLFFVTGPSEEIFWRGFLQKQLIERFGGLRGWMLATAIYAGVHIWSFNFMLIGASAVAGAFWGLIYWRTGNLALVIVSHSVWSAVVFALLPIP
ncbi:MAG: CPBP family intramembrane glutamic endopeptidase [Desulfobacterales bacterium]